MIKYEEIEYCGKCKYIKISDSCEYYCKLHKEIIYGTILRICKEYDGRKQ